MLDGYNNKITIKPISCIVENATSFFKSIWIHIFKDASNILIIVTVKKNQFKLSENRNINLYKPKIADFTKIPLKKIENPVLASTWVLLNQKWNGHKGTLTAKPKKISIVASVDGWINSLFIKLCSSDWLKYIKTPNNTRKEPNWVHNKK